MDAGVPWDRACKINYIILDNLIYGDGSLLPIYLLTYLPACLPICLPAYLFAYLPTYLPTYLPYLPAYLPTYLCQCLVQFGGRVGPIEGSDLFKSSSIAVRWLYIQTVVV